MKFHFLWFYTERSLCWQRSISRLTHKQRAAFLPHKLCTKSLSSSFPSLTPRNCTITCPVSCVFKTRSFENKKKTKYTWLETFSGSLVTLFTCQLLCSSRPILAMFCQAFTPSILPQAAWINPVRDAMSQSHPQHFDFPTHNTLALLFLETLIPPFFYF